MIHHTEVPLKGLYDEVTSQGVLIGVRGVTLHHPILLTILIVPLVSEVVAVLLQSSVSPELD